MIYFSLFAVFLASTKLKDTQISTVNNIQDIDTFKPDSTGLLSSSMRPLAVSTQEFNDDQANMLRMDKVKQKLSTVLVSR